MSIFLHGRGREFMATAVPLASLVRQLSGETRRIVYDKTGLTGKYDLKLNWMPDDMPPASDSADYPFLFTALQEQLGLKLQPSKAEVQTLVVDHIEQPSEN